MKNLLIFLVFATLLNAEIIAKTTTLSAQGTGFGASRVEAINNAIIEALGKLNGVQVSNQKFISTAMDAKNGKSELKDKYSSKLNVITKGKIDGFDIIDVSENDGKFEAQVIIKKIRTTKKYKAPGLDEKNRRKMAIFPVFSEQKSYEILDKNVNSTTLTNRLTQNLAQSIINTRKFSVLDRISDERIYEIEENIIRSKSASKDEILKLGNVLGADYILIANIADCKMSQSGSNLTTTSKNRLNIALEYRILLMATRQIKFANTRNFSFILKGDNVNENLANITKSIANSISNEIINNIYPLKIAKIQKDGTIILSQSLKVGEIYDVFALGDRIIDAYTKESVGKDEKFVAKIEITRASPKISYAKIIKGKAKVGEICRPSDDISSQNSNIGKDSDVTINENGAVVLPF